MQPHQPARNGQPNARPTSVRLLRVQASEQLENGLVKPRVNADA
jgi:hypothetical protein